MAQTLHLPGTSEVTSTYVMERVATADGDRWRYWALDARGAVELSGVDNACARCHADAPLGAEVFGAPRR